MTRKMTPEEVKRWQQGHLLAQRAQQLERQALTTEDRLRMIALISNTAKVNGWAEVRHPQEEEVWETWRRLREAYVQRHGR